MIQDLKYALRQFAKSPGFTLVALLTLALGIGANTALFSVMDRLLYRPLPVPAPERLAILAVPQQDGSFDQAFNYPLFLDYQRENTVFENLCATSLESVGVGTSAGTERRQALVVSGNYFSMLHVVAALGRTFSPDEGIVIDDAPVAVISYGLWLAQFGGDPQVIGKKLLVDSHPFTVIGVAPREFTGTSRGQTPDLYVPFTMYGQLTDQRPGGEHPLNSRYFTWLHIIGRLKEGVSHEQASAAMTSLTQRIHGIMPNNTPENLSVIKGAQGDIGTVSEARKPLHLLLAISVLVLLVACANLANLQLARASGRAREFAVRMALGASRTRMWRSLLAESVLLSLAGGALGILVAVGINALLQKVQLPNEGAAMKGGYEAFALAGELNFRLLVFTGAVAVLTGVIFGLAPAWEASRTQPVNELKNGSGATEARRWRTFRGSLVVLQVAVSLVVLICAGLFSRSLRQLQQTDPGFEPSRVMLMSLDLGLNSASPLETATFYQQLLERTLTLPGVEVASLSLTTPLDGKTPRWSVDRIEGYESKPDEHPWAGANFVSPGYFKVFGIPLIMGRDFTPADTTSSPRVAIVDESFAQLYHRGEMSTGWHFYFPPENPGGKPEAVEVIGIVRSIRGESLDQSPQRIAYCPNTQVPWQGMTLAVRTGLAPASITKAIRDLVKSLDAHVPVFQVRTIEQQFSSSLGYQHLATALLNGFSALALLLVAVGLYGVLAYSVSLRTREIGVRLALGAKISDVLRLVLQQGLRLVVIGLFLGLLGAFAGTRLIRSQLYGISPLDPLVFGAITVLFVIVAVLAYWLPARRATKVDPLVALRTE